MLNFFILTTYSLFAVGALTSPLSRSHLRSHPRGINLRTLDAVPDDATHLAVEEEGRSVIVFGRDGVLGRVLAGGSHHVKRDNASCSALSVDELEGLSGWDTLVTTAQSNWGDGSWSIVTNPDDYPEYSANSCISTNTVQVTTNGDPECETYNSTSGGTLVGTNGSVTLSTSEGTTFSATDTVTSESSLSEGLTVSVQLSVPDAFNIGTEMTSTTTITNTQSTSTTTSTNNLVTNSITMEAPEGETCSLTYTTKSCTASGTGSIQFLASGWVWFDYNSETDGHYKWALNIAEVISNEANRSSYLEFTSAMSTETQSQYSGSCS